MQFTCYILKNQKIICAKESQIIYYFNKQYNEF